MPTRRFSPVATWLLLAAPLFAKESVCLKTGFCLQADSHTQQNGIVRLQTLGGSMEFAADQIAEIIVLPEAPAAAPALTATSSNAAGSITAEESVMLAAIQQGLEPDFVRSVARVESDLRQNAVSPKGALGVMQLMPATAAGLGVDPELIDQNALGGAKFLRELLLRYRGNSALALAAYNAGPGAVDKFGGVPPYLETQRYVAKVLREYARQQLLQTKATAAKKVTAAKSASTAAGAGKPAVSKPSATN